MAAVTSFRIELSPLAQERWRPVTQLVERALAESCLRGLVLHGSLTRGTSDDFSDVDLVAVVAAASGTNFTSKLRKWAVEDSGVLFVGQTNRFEWFGRLTSIYWKCPHILAVDFGVVEDAEVSRFFIEPDALILKDFDANLERRKRECFRNALKLRRQLPSIAEFEAFSLMIKLRKSLYRGHLWNAIEYVSLLRRLYVTLVRSQLLDDPQYVHVGRPERDAEHVLPEKVLAELKCTLPHYSHQSIACAARNLMLSILELPGVSEAWTIKPQLLEISGELELEHASY
jgi:hypothetical protein